MFRFLTSTFTLEVLMSGLALTALGGAGAVFPVVMNFPHKSEGEEGGRDSAPAPRRDAFRQ